MIRPQQAYAASATFAPAEDWPFSHHFDTAHDVRVVETGIADLELRLRMIDRAHSYIDCMTYIFTPDHVGVLLLNAMLRAARRGVRVRFLLDWNNNSGQPGLSENLAAGLQQLLPPDSRANFEVRYYNKGTMLLNPVKMNHRNHAKLFVVDGKELLMGGRNLSDAFFGLSSSQNYTDRDVWLTTDFSDFRSSVPLAAHAAFDAYWSDPAWVMSATPGYQGSLFVINLLKTKTYQSWQRNFRSRLHLLSLPYLGEANDERQGTIAMPTFHVTNIDFVMDRGGHAASDRHVTPYFQGLLRRTNRLALFDAWTTSTSKKLYDIFQTLSLDAHIPLIFISNGPLSTDNETLGKFAGEEDKRLLALPDTRIFQMNSQRPAMEPRIDTLGTGHFGEHAKTAVLYSQETSTAIIGSYNLDGRSEIYNNEVMLSVNNDNLFSENLTKAILARTSATNLARLSADQSKSAEPHSLSEVLSNVPFLKDLVHNLY